MGKVKKSVSWSNDIEIYTTERVESERRRSMFYTQEDYENFEIEAIQNELFRMSEAGRINEVSLAINRWMESEMSSGGGGTLYSYDNSNDQRYQPPAQPSRRSSTEENQSSNNNKNNKENNSDNNNFQITTTRPPISMPRTGEQFLSIELPAFILSGQPPTKPSRRGSIECTVSMRPQPRRGSIECTVSVNPPNKPTRRISMEMPEDFFHGNAQKLLDISQHSQQAQQQQQQQQQYVEIPVGALAPRLSYRRFSIDAAERINFSKSTKNLSKYLNSLSVSMH